MKFFTLLKCGLSAKEVADMFVAESIEAHMGISQSFAKFMIEFSEELLRTIGFDFNIEPETLEREKDITWPEHFHTYNYVYNKSDMDLLELFFIELCKTYHEQDLMVDNKDLNDPIGIYVQIMVVWINVCQSMRRHDKGKIFEQPIAILNLYLLRATHVMRKTYRDEIPVLDTICNRLYKFALEGINYDNIYVQMVKKLLSLFEQDFDLFHASSPQSLNIFYEIFTTNYENNDAYLITFNMLVKCLEATQNDEKLRILTNVLIKSDMIDVYNQFLQKKISKVLLTVLEFLSRLQNTLLDLDCFSLGFIDKILLLVMNKCKNVDRKAAGLFMQIMIRKFNAFDIIQYIEHFFFKSSTNLDNLSGFLNTLFPYMSREMLSPDIFINLIKSNSENADDVDKSVQLMHINFFVEFLNQFLKDSENHQQTIKIMLKEVPSFLALESCILAKGSLFQIYTLLNDEQMSSIEELKNIENFAVQEFVTCNNATHPYMINLLALLVRCLSYSKNTTSFEHLVTYHAQELFDIEKHYEQDILDGNILSYRDILMKLSLLMQIQLDALVDTKRIFEAITRRLYDKNQLYSLAIKSNTFIDVYACEILTQCIINEFTEEIVDSNWLKAGTYKFLDYLICSLRDTVELDNYHYFRRKVMFICICSLCCNYLLPKGLKLPQSLYNHLVVNFIDLVFAQEEDKKKSLNIDSVEEWEPTEKRIREYQEQVFESFISLHKEEKDIPSSLIWQVISFFGKHPNKFENEMINLLNVLADKHFLVYRQSLPIAIFNLCKNDKTTSREITTCIKAHRDFIEEHFDRETADVLKLSSVISCFQMLRSKVQKYQVQSSYNRLAILNHLKVLAHDFNLLPGQVENVILENVRPLAEYHITPDERRCLTNFITDFKKQSRVII